ncbi:hypothetical protein CANCADRAFT_84847 [Tortispora caseinolytica NRRL Y-17796]|uniref:Uncharacterized protein n=1 Tax=Tortispora caseinolytica NRRL Y-17796 TaxID=767744 RepID=A0A1E4TKR7_9ASCO|nr:hypothetical protein CANCADRAFT_84847 [Tortispora caseinolytica NRRL Y-17796]
MSNNEYKPWRLSAGVSVPDQNGESNTPLDDIEGPQQAIESISPVSDTASPANIAIDVSASQDESFENDLQSPTLPNILPPKHEEVTPSAALDSLMQDLSSFSEQSAIRDNTLDLAVPGKVATTAYDTNDTHQTDDVDNLAYDMSRIYSEEALAIDVNSAAATTFDADEMSPGYAEQVKKNDELAQDIYETVSNPSRGHSRNVSQVSNISISSNSSRKPVSIPVIPSVIANPSRHSRGASSDGFEDFDPGVGTIDSRASWMKGFDDNEEAELGIAAPTSVRLASVPEFVDSVQLPLQDDNTLQIYPALTEDENYMSAEEFADNFEAPEQNKMDEANDANNIADEIANYEANDDINDDISDDVKDYNNDINNGIRNDINDFNDNHSSPLVSVESRSSAGRSTSLNTTQIETWPEASIPEILPPIADNDDKLPGNVIVSNIDDSLDSKANERSDTFTLNEFDTTTESDTDVLRWKPVDSYKDSDDSDDNELDGQSSLKNYNSIEDYSENDSRKDSDLFSRPDTDTPLPAPRPISMIINDIAPEENKSVGTSKQVLTTLDENSDATGNDSNGIGNASIDSQGTKGSETGANYNLNQLIAFYTNSNDYNDLLKALNYVQDKSLLQFNRKYDFRSLTSKNPSSKERQKAYNEARLQEADVNIGLDLWLAYSSGQLTDILNADGIGAPKTAAYPKKQFISQDGVSLTRTGTSSSTTRKSSGASHISSKMHNMSHSLKNSSRLGMDKSKGFFAKSKNIMKNL